ncbi:MAG: DUF2791 family P-loop domain-containing protein [Dehalococcoidia bacterium]|nr:DUF2791 family P-loop domain-containing protein [Dehalococcoidia bacterium]
MPNHQVGDAARKWLRGENCTAAELKLIDGVSKLATSDHATRTLSTICRLIAGFSRFRRIVLMLDEFQRIAQLPEKRRLEVNSGIHTWFNSCPDGLSILLVYSIGVASTIKHLVSPEVLSRVSQTFELPALTEPESVEFVEGLVASAAESGDSRGIFEHEGVVETVHRLAEDSAGRLTPRRLMLGFTTILEDALSEGAFPIGREFAAASYVTPPADSF